MVIEAAGRLNEVKEYYFSGKLRQLAQMRSDGKDIINLGIGNPDLSPSSITIDHIVNCLNSDEAVHGYQPYRGTPELVFEMKSWYKRTYQLEQTHHFDLVPLMGSKEGIMHISMAFLNKGDKILIPDPGYPAYSAVARLLEAEAITYSLNEENNWQPDFQELKEIVKEQQIKMMWINYPHMPTGTKAKYSVLSEIVNFCRSHQILLVHDNPYSLILNDKPLSIFCIPKAEEVAIELNSLSKSHNMAGWRVGMLVGRSDYVDTIMKVKTNFDSGMFKAVQKGAIGALQNDNRWHQFQNDIYRKRRNIAFRILDKLNCTYTKDIAGMFVWAKIPEQYKNGEGLSDFILQTTDVFITPGFIFGKEGERYIRISLCVSEQRLTEALVRIQESQN